MQNYLSPIHFSDIDVLQHVRSLLSGSLGESKIPQIILDNSIKENQGEQFIGKGDL